jgi:hypothetical protein
MLTKFEKKKRILFGMKKQTHTKKNKNKKHGQSLKTQMIMTKPNNFVPEHSVDFISILILMKKVVQKYCLKFIMKSNHLTKNTLYFDPQCGLGITLIRFSQVIRLEC